VVRHTPTHRERFSRLTVVARPRKRSSRFFLSQRRK